jgi:hypothetical protein
MSRKKLTERQRRFVEEFALNGNATRAAIAAGYSAKSARTYGARMFADRNIAAAIRQRRDNASKRIDISADKVLQGFAQIAFHKQPLGELSPQDRIRALNSLGKHLGLFIDKQEIDISTRLQDALSTIKSNLPPAVQQEFLNAVGRALDEDLAPGASEAADEPDGKASDG